MVFLWTDSNLYIGVIGRDIRAKQVFGVLNNIKSIETIPLFYFAIFHCSQLTIPSEHLIITTCMI